MEIKLIEHVSKEQTPWGVVNKPLGQDIVLLLNTDTNQYVQCGYVGKTAFLPLAGFPQASANSVAEQCARLLGRPIEAAMSPPGLEELAAMLNKDSESDE